MWALVILSLPAVFAPESIIQAAVHNARQRGASPGIRLLAWSTPMLTAARGWIAPALLLFITTFVVHARMDNVRNQEDLDARKDR